jgi:hypothetical protein
MTKDQIIHSGVRTHVLLKIHSIYCRTQFMFKKKGLHSLYIFFFFSFIVCETVQSAMLSFDFLPNLAYLARYTGNGMSFLQKNT